MERTDQQPHEHSPTAPIPPAAVPALARCTGNCTTTHQPTTPDWTRDKWGWLCPKHTHARTNHPSLDAAKRTAVTA